MIYKNVKIDTEFQSSLLSDIQKSLQINSTRIYLKIYFLSVLGNYQNIESLYMLAHEIFRRFSDGVGKLEWRLNRL